MPAPTPPMAPATALSDQNGHGKPDHHPFVHAPKTRFTPIISPSGRSPRGARDRIARGRRTAVGNGKPQRRARAPVGRVHEMSASVSFRNGRASELSLRAPLRACGNRGASAARQSAASASSVPIIHRNGPPENSPVAISQRSRANRCDRGALTTVKCSVTFGTISGPFGGGSARHVWHRSATPLLMHSRCGESADARHQIQRKEYFCHTIPVRRCWSSDGDSGSFRCASTTLLHLGRALMREIWAQSSKTGRDEPHSNAVCQFQRAPVCLNDVVVWHFSHERPNEP
jgi:hypothetical protein